MKKQIRILRTALIKYGQILGKPPRRSTSRSTAEAQKFCDDKDDAVDSAAPDRAHPLVERSTGPGCSGLSNGPELRMLVVMLHARSGKDSPG